MDYFLHVFQTFSSRLIVIVKINHLRLKLLALCKHLPWWAAKRSDRPAVQWLDEGIILTMGQNPAEGKDSLSRAKLSWIVVNRPL